jgi:voltage-gated potassium channel Kch
MDAGSNFDLNLVFQEWPTVLIGSLVLLGVKGLTLAAATRIPPRFEPNRLPTADALRVSILLSGGGEFAFVVLALSEKLGIIDQYCIRMLTAIVLVTMGVTPLLGDLATTLSNPLVEAEENSHKPATAAEPIAVVSYNAIVVCGHAETGRAVMRVLSDRQAANANHQLVDGDAPGIVAFSRNPGLVDSVLRPGGGTVVLYGDGNNPEVIRSSGVSHPRAIFVTYEEHNRAISATARLRAAFPDTPIYARATKRIEARNLQLAGATEAVVECDELAKSVPLLMRGEYGAIDDNVYNAKEDFRVAASTAAAIPFSVVDELFELYDSLDMCATGLLDRGELIELFRKTKKGFIASDKEIKEMESWLETTTSAHMNPMDRIEFCRLYGRAPEFVKQSFGIMRQVKD